MEWSSYGKCLAAVPVPAALYCPEELEQAEGRPRVSETASHLRPARPRAERHAASSAPAASSASVAGSGIVETKSW